MPEALTGVQQSNELRKLPKWIRAFSWLFLILGPCGVVGVHVAAAFVDGPMSFSFLGFSYAGRPLDAPALIVQVALVAFSVAAYGLLWERSWGVWAGLACGVVGLMISLSAMLAAWYGGRLVVQFEPLFQVPFVVALWRRRHGLGSSPRPAS